MKRALPATLAAVVVLAVAQVAYAAPGTVSTPFAQANSSTRIRTVEATARHIFVGGAFNSFRDTTGVNRNVTNLAVLNLDGTWASFTPNIGGSGEVWDIEPFGDGVLVAGNFGTGPSKNLVAISATGQLTWYSSAPGLKTVTTDGVNVYGGGQHLSMWSSPNTRVYAGRSAPVTNPNYRVHQTPGQYRDLLFWDGALYAACQCDNIGSLSGPAVKTMVRLTPSTGELDPTFDLSTDFGQGVASAAFGISVATDGSALYLGAGGSDFLAKITFASDVVWQRDTSGSSQSVEFFDDQVVAGGHFVEVADEPGDNCGFRGGSGNPNLDPNDMCQRRDGLAVYTSDGQLTSYAVTLKGQYNLAWAIEPLFDGSMIVGGEFNKANDVDRNDLVRLI